MILLTILDGWGINEDTVGNAFKLGNTPTLDNILKNYPTSRITPSGPVVGLPEGQMGNSEVGHLNIGAGRIVNQSFQRINIAIQDKSLFSNDVILHAMENAKKNGTALHLMGLVSDGGVHSNNNHIYALLEMAKERGVEKVFVHCFMDGRDTPPQSGHDYIKELQDKMTEIGIGEVATVIGRFYAMDRDNRWERVQVAYDALTSGEGILAADPLKAIKDSYNEGVTDEFIKPIVITKDEAPLAKISDNDSVLFFNFRPDRAREISYPFTNPEFNGFNRKVSPKVEYVCMTEYAKDIKADIAFKPIELKNVLAEVLANNNKKQLHIAETEKYAHVTFFFNGGEEVEYEGEDRILVPSPQVATYDLKPEMSAFEVKDKVVEAINSKKYDVIILNFANPDMVGHTGILEAAIKAIEAVDQCVKEVTEAVLANDGKMILTADHGNLEKMKDGEEPYTAHTTFDVPLVYISNDQDARIKDRAILADIAPTILNLLNIDKPEEMTGESFIC